MLTPGGSAPSIIVTVPTPLAKKSIALFTGIPTLAVKVSWSISGSAGGKISKTTETETLSAPSITLSETGYVLVTKGAVVVGVPKNCAEPFREIPGGRVPELISSVGLPAPKKFTLRENELPTVAVRVSPLEGEMIEGGGTLPVSDLTNGRMVGR
jgi:hypothetical protein